MDANRQDLGSQFDEGIVEAYMAVYAERQDVPTVTVYGLRFRSAGMAKTFWGNSRLFRNTKSIVAGSLVAVALGDNNDCRADIVAYLKSLAN